MDWISNAIRSIDWATLSNIAVVVSAIFFIRQLSEMRKTTQAQAYSVALERLQNEKVRNARRIVFHLKGKPIEKWNKEEIEAAEIVCHTYDTIAQIVRNNLLSRSIIIQSWGPSLRNSWPILSPLIRKYREDFEAQEYWDDYEWLATQAQKARSPNKIGAVSDNES